MSPSKKIVAGVCAAALGFVAFSDSAEAGRRFGGYGGYGGYSGSTCPSQSGGYGEFPIEGTPVGEDDAAPVDEAPPPPEEEEVEDAGEVDEAEAPADDEAAEEPAEDAAEGEDGVELEEAPEPVADEGDDEETEDDAAPAKVAKAKVSKAKLTSKSVDDESLVPDWSPGSMEEFLQGNWTARPTKKIKVKLTLKANHTFKWSQTVNGEESEFSGTFKVTGGKLTLTRSDSRTKVTGVVAAKNDDAFSLKLPNGKAPLKFTR